MIIGLNRERCVDAFGRLGIADFRERIADGCRQEDLFMQFEAGNISPERFRDGIRRMSRRLLADEEINASWIAMLGDIPEEKFELLLELRQRYHVFLLSNTKLIHGEWVERNSFSYKTYRADDFLTVFIFLTGFTIGEVEILL